MIYAPCRKKYPSCPYTALLTLDPRNNQRCLQPVNRVNTFLEFHVLLFCQDQIVCPLMTRSYRHSCWSNSHSTRRNPNSNICVNTIKPALRLCAACGCTVDFFLWRNQFLWSSAKSCNRIHCSLLASCARTCDAPSFEFHDGRAPLGHLG